MSNVLFVPSKSEGNSFTSAAWPHVILTSVTMFVRTPVQMCALSQIFVLVFPCLTSHHEEYDIVRNPDESIAKSCSMSAKGDADILVRLSASR